MYEILRDKLRYMRYRSWDRWGRRLFVVLGMDRDRLFGDTYFESLVAGWNF